jgi:hypothetical protein
MDKKYRRYIAVAGLAIAGIAVGATAVDAQSSGGEVEGTELDGAEDTREGPDVAITGPDLDSASAAALAFTGEGRVTATEVGDEESYYEVEVTLDSGSQVDVQLDKDFNVVGTD